MRALLVVALLTGCSMAPKYERPKIPAAPAYKELSGWKRAEPSDHVLRSNWWQLFGDPELDALVASADAANPTLAAALANFRVARAVLKQARAGYYPTLSVNPQFTRVRQRAVDPRTGASTTSTSNIIALPVDAAWEPDLWGSVTSSVNAAKHTAEASYADLENVRLSMRAEVALNYFQIRARDSQREILASTVTAFEASLALARARYQTGIASEQDVAQAETQLASVRAQQSDLGIQRAQLEHALAVLLGKAPAEFSLRFDPLQKPPIAIPVGVPSALLERRPDIAAAERRVAAANAQIGVARAAYFPTLTLSGSAGYLSSSFPALFNWPSFVWSVGASLSETLFDGGRREGVSAQAWANYAGTVATYRQTVLSAFQEVEDNLVALRLLGDEIRDQTAAVEWATRSLTLAMDRYQLGIDSYLNVVTAQTTLLENQLTLVGLRLNLVAASVQLIKALGGGWDGSTLEKAASKQR